MRVSDIQACKDTGIMSYFLPTFHTHFLFFATLPQGILASTLTSEPSCATFHRLGVIALAGERGSRARNTKGTAIMS